MGFNMAFILVNENKTTLLQIARGLKRIDPAYVFELGEYEGFYNAERLLLKIDKHLM